MGSFMQRIGVCVHRRLSGEMSCAQRGGHELLDALKLAWPQETAIDVFGLACLGECERGIAVKIVGGDLLTGLSPMDVAGVEKAVSDSLDASVSQGS